MNYYKFIKFLIVAIASIVMLDSAAQDNTDEIHDPAEYLSHTLPVLYVNTVDGVPITSKKVYLDGVYWLDATGFDEYESIGSADAPLPLQIRGRGNATWRSLKKPYRIKLDKKAALMGMNKSKHWCLMAETIGLFFADLLAFEYSNRLGIPWAPTMKPVEMVLNGDYVGVYFITEKIRIANDRVNITEQDDRETDPEAITGGWLFEIDNYADPQQVVFNDRGGGKVLRITWHSPDTLSQQQYDYMYNLLYTTDSLIYVPDKTSTEWERYIDIDALAKFYIANELMDNCESFSGSCFFYKDRGAESKIIFGPMWDAGSCFSHYAIGMREFIYNQIPAYASQHWIAEIAKFPHFQAVVQRFWREQVIGAHLCDSDDIDDFINNIATTLGDAIANDYRRWSAPPGLANITSKASKYRSSSRKKYEWLNLQWGTPPIPGDVNRDQTVDVDDVGAVVSFILGSVVESFDYDAADCMRDDDINVDDVNKIISIILQK